MDLEQTTLINELKQGRELANQLKNHLDTTSPQTCEFLLEKILSSYEKSLSMLNWSALMKQQLPVDSLADAISPKSETFEHDSKYKCHKNVFKKRKVTMPRWGKEVRVCEGALDDGYSWRKYGQKDILRTNFPRAYYRCTHRHTQGCLATKQVQKSDEDPSIFEITYRGKHTCIQTSPFSSLEKESPKENKHHPHFEPQQEEIQHQPEEILFNSHISLESEDIFPSFSFPSTPLGYENAESNSFPQWQMNCFGILDYNLHSSDSSHTEIISAPTSVANSPIGDFEFSVDQVDFKTNFPFDIQEFFS
ncbi:hypothetical protein LguiA_010471 [Lonicera macranthoides]